MNMQFPSVQRIVFALLVFLVFVVSASAQTPGRIVKFDGLGNPADDSDIREDASQKIGVGINPQGQFKFLVNGGRFGARANTGGNIGALTAIQNGTGAIASFRTNDKDIKVIVENDGSVGIGTDTPVHELHVVGNLNLERRTGHPNTVLLFDADPVLRRTNIAVEMGMISAVALPVDIYSAGVERIRVDTNGDVGIGTTSPSERLHVIGNICATGTIAMCSDARFKKEIKPLDNALANIQKLQGVHFSWNDHFRELTGATETNGPQIGLVAQDVEKIYPEVVSIGSDGYRSVDYGKITAVLIEAIKAQQAQIDELKRELSTFKNSSAAQ